MEGSLDCRISLPPGSLGGAIRIFLMGRVKV